MAVISHLSERLMRNRVENIEDILRLERVISEILELGNNEESLLLFLKDCSQLFQGHQRHNFSPERDRSKRVFFARI